MRRRGGIIKYANYKKKAIEPVKFCCILRKQNMFKNFFQ